MWKWSSRQVCNPISQEAIVRRVYSQLDGVWTWDQEFSALTAPEPEATAAAGGAGGGEVSQTLRLLSADKGSEPHASFESVAAAPRSQLSRKKVFCLQAATGEYAWEYPQGEDESGSGGGPDRSEEAAPIKVFSLLQQESGGVWVWGWGWSSQSTAFQKVVAPASSSFSSSSSSNSSLQSKSLSLRSPAEGKEESYKPAQFPAAGGEAACQGFLSIFVPCNSHLSCPVLC